MTIYVDIDNTICRTYGNNYPDARPLPENIKKINKLFDEGNEIIYWTARGRTSGTDWEYLTKNQLKEWGCKYHLLMMNVKPCFDLIIDDRAKRIEEI
jgi:hypothetical protein